MIKKLWKHRFLWLGGSCLALVLAFWVTQQEALFDDAKPSAPKAKQELITTTAGSNINLEEKSSVHLPFIKNEGQIGEDKVSYYASIFSGTLFVTDEALTYRVKTTVEQSNEELGLDILEEDTSQLVE